MSRPITKVKYIISNTANDMEHSINKTIDEILKDDVFDVIDIKHAMANDGGTYIYIYIYIYIK